MRTIGWMTALVVAAAAAMPAMGKDAPRVVKEAVPLAVGEWLGADNYPPAAIRAGEQGRVVAVVTIDATGHPTACRIDISIGSPVLEKGTCDVVLAKGKFEPARDAKGRAVASTLTLPVRWVLPEDGDNRQPSGPFDLTHIATIAADDSIIRCEITVDGKPQPAAAEQCGGAGDRAELRRRLKLSGPYRMRMDVAIRNADTPPPLPAAPGTGRLLTVYEAREAIDADGVPSHCTIAVVGGDWAEEARKYLDKTPCETGQRFFPVRGKDGAPKPAQVLIATWLTLLPPPN